MINIARSFALAAHGDQKYGNLPYSFHLDEVASIARKYGETAEILAYLHDVIEDTDVTAVEIKDTFGSFTAKCVHVLSDEPGDTRKIRKSATYHKMAKIEGELVLALLVKAADRLANMRHATKTQDKNFINLYRAEYKVFKKSVYRQNLCDDIWSELDTLQGK